jgi:hypothetical protein
LTWQSACGIIVYIVGAQLIVVTLTLDYERIAINYY